MLGGYCPHKEVVTNVVQAKETIALEKKQENYLKSSSRNRFNNKRFDERSRGQRWQNNQFFAKMKVGDFIKRFIIAMVKIVIIINITTIETCITKISTNKI
jgi:hypothetical protein